MKRSTTALFALLTLATACTPARIITTDDARAMMLDAQYLCNQLREKKEIRTEAERVECLRAKIIPVVTNYSPRYVPVFNEMYDRQKEAANQLDTGEISKIIYSQKLGVTADVAAGKMMQVEGEIQDDVASRQQAAMAFSGYMNAQSAYYNQQSQIYQQRAAQPSAHQYYQPNPVNCSVFRNGATSGDVGSISCNPTY